MDSFSTNAKEDGPMELPPGFRFHPTDEELITHYLSEKVLNSNFDAIAIGEADLNRIEPWDLSSVAKLGEKEWYFFVVRDRKYPTGQRTNRATEKGYWKATGKDREIYRAKTLVGMKKTLVFYTGRAPRGEKTNWVMHEFRLEGKCSKPKNAKNDWVISRVFKKNSSAKKLDYSQFVRIDELQPRFLPPLMDSSPCNNSCETKAVTANPGHVTCFSNSSCVMEEENHLVKATTKEEEMFMLSSPNNTVSTTPFVSFTNMISEPDMPDYQFVDSISTQCDSVMMKLLYEDANNYLWNY